MKTLELIAGIGVVLGFLGAPAMGQDQASADEMAKVLLADLGQIDFPNSGSEEAQQDFILGALLLHSFEYEDAAESFRAAQETDPSFALAYWGEALTHSHPIWQEDDPEKAHEILERYAPTAAERYKRAPTEREKGLMACVDTLYGDGDRVARNAAYSEAMGRLHERFPEDLEIKSLYALSILGTSVNGRDERIYMRAASVAEEVYAINPKHPGALHYLIHSYDDPVHAPLGLRMARRYDVVAPAAAHALHMPSHIYVALGMWEESARANVASAAAADARRERKGLDTDARGYHALWWLLYTRLQQGQFGAARHLLANMVRDEAESGSRRTRSHLALMHGAFLVETERWDEPVPDFELGRLWVSTTSAYQLALGISLARRGEFDEAEAVRADMRRRILDRFAEDAGYEAEEADSDAAVDPSNRRTADDGDDSDVSDPTACCLPADASDGSIPPGRRAAMVAEQLLEGLILFERGEVNDGLVRLQEACDDEDSMPFDFGPPMVVKPAHELTGEVLLELGRANEARDHFEAALRRAPRRARSLLGLTRACAVIGDVTAANAALDELATIWRGADSSLRELVETERRALAN